MEAVFRTTLSQRGALDKQMSDERRVLDQLRELDGQGIALIYDRYFSEVFRFVFFRLGDRNTSEDIASDVFVRLLEALQERRGPHTNIKGWLIGTASHAVNDHLRHQYRHSHEPLSEALPDSGPAVPVEFDKNEQSESVKSAYARLTNDQQNVLALRFSQGYTLEETATIMRKSANAVKALQFRALAALQRVMDEMHYE